MTKLLLFVNFWFTGCCVNRGDISSCIGVALESGVVLEGFTLDLLREGVVFVCSLFKDLTICIFSYSARTILVHLQKVSLTEFVGISQGCNNLYIQLFSKNYFSSSSKSPFDSNSAKTIPVHLQIHLKEFVGISQPIDRCFEVLIAHAFHWRLQTLHETYHCLTLRFLAQTHKNVPTVYVRFA